jgi:hypothetical protein
MDVLAHALWAGLGVAALRRRWPIGPRAVAATVALAVLPDMVQLAPLIGRSLADGDVAVLHAYATARPGSEPSMSSLAALWTHHLHCVMHSAPVAALVTLLSWLALRRLWIPLLGWWSHIVIDVFTHSAAYYAVPVFYPFTDWGFDGLAWNTPWFLTANYAAIAAAGWWLVRRRAA